MVRGCFQRSPTQFCSRTWAHTVMQVDTKLPTMFFCFFSSIPQCTMSGGKLGTSRNPVKLGSTRTLVNVKTRGTQVKLGSTGTLVNVERNGTLVKLGTSRTLMPAAAASSQGLRGRGRRWGATPTPTFYPCHIFLPN